MAEANATVNLELTSSQALVLFEYLSRFSDTDDPSIVDQSEQRVLWSLCCALESILVEPFRPDYAELLEAARAANRGDESGVNGRTDR